MEHIEAIHDLQIVLRELKVNLSLDGHPLILLKLEGSYFIAQTFKSILCIARM